MSTDEIANPVGVPERKVSDMSPNRRVVANISLSLDGRVSGIDGDYDMSWIVPHAVTDTARSFQARMIDDVTTVVLGRKNYEGFGAYWPPVAVDDDADPRDRAWAQWLDAVEKVAISSTLDAAGWPNSRVVDDDPAAVVEKLQADGGGDIIVLASVSVIQALLAAGAVDRLIVNLCPEVVGGGRAFFTDAAPRSSWTLAESAPTESGSIYVVLDKADAA